MADAQSKRVLEICTDIMRAQKELETKRKQLKEALREGFGCGPRMNLDEQMAFMAELWFSLQGD